MRVIFIGCFYPSDREEEIWLNSKDALDNAANNLQWALLEGFDHFYADVKVIIQPAIGTYPLKYKDLYFKGSSFPHKSDSLDYCLGFINVPLIKHLSKYLTLLGKLVATVNLEEETVIIIYGIHSPFLKAAVDIKKKNPKIKICLIVPDLPQYMSESKNPVYRFFKSIDSILINKYLKKIDSFVLLTDIMAEELNIKQKPWIRIEGISINYTSYETVTKEKNKTILYTGKLDYRYGIMNLIEAFISINSDTYRLWICGDGDSRKDIEKISILDRRILYLGQLKHEEVLILQKRATVLVNPRTSEGMFTKFSFPYKTIEYLASGTPTIIHRLKGIPDEYYNYCYIAEEENAESLKSAILHVCEKDQSELNEFGRRASCFILENKNPITQVKKIYDMLNDLN